MTTPNEAILILNEIAHHDPAAITALVNHRVPCGEWLAQHPTVQVGRTETGYEVGLLGIINGLFGVDENGWGLIAAVESDTGEVVAFQPFNP